MIAPPKAKYAPLTADAIDITIAQASLPIIIVAEGKLMKENILVARKSIVAACHIKKGDLFTENNLTVKRPASGLSPMYWEEVIGTKADKDYEEDDLIQL